MATVHHITNAHVTLDGLVISVILILMNVVIIMVAVIKRVPTLLEIIIARVTVDIIFHMMDWDVTILMNV
jgi:hypothetical protein